MTAFKKFYDLGLSIFICFFAGSVGSYFTYPEIKVWYTSINKPSFNPPNWIFGPVWSILYLLMGIALFLVWQKRKTVDVRFAIGLFAVQLILNTTWSVVFFGSKDLFAAFVVIIILALMILFTMISFYRISKTASLLLLPYLLWVSFASYLNYSILLLNR